MKVFFVLLLTGATALALSSCKSYSKTAVSADIDGPTVIQKPVIADLDVQEKKVTGTATGKGTKRIKELKEAALNDALSKSKADVLIEPRYEIDTRGNKTTINVTGYPGTYKNFRSMEPADTMFINKKGLDTDRGSINRFDKKDNKARRRRIFGMSVGGFLGAFALAGLIALIF